MYIKFLASTAVPIQFHGGSIGVTSLPYALWEFHSEHILAIPSTGRLRRHSLSNLESKVQITENHCHIQLRTSVLQSVNDDKLLKSKAVLRRTLVLQQEHITNLSFYVCSTQA